MIKIFSWVNKRIKKKDLLFFIDFYEKKYLFLSEIPEYEERKKELLQRKIVDYVQFNKWVKENYPEDVYSKCYLKRRCNIKTCSCRTMYGGIEYIHIWTFSEDIIPVIEKAVEVNNDYLVIDLRDNCGGSVEVLTKCLFYFLRGKGSIEIQDKNESKLYNVVGNGRLYDKIFLFVNENTMSCAEILMMVLYENMKNVYIVGGPTFKKDTGQTTVGKGKVVFSITNFHWYVSGKDVRRFWMEPEERMVGTKEQLSERDMMEFVYFQSRQLRSDDQRKSSSFIKY